MLWRSHRMEQFNEQFNKQLGNNGKTLKEFKRCLTEFGTW